MSLKVKNLSFGYSKKKILNDISFELENELFTVLLGANGSGKSTLFKLILGFYKNYSGEILINEKESRDISMRNRSRMIAYIPQSAHTIYSYDAFDMVLMGRISKNGLFESPKELDYKKAIEAMDMIGIAHLKGRGFRCLSGGEKQLVLIARAIAQECNLIIMDEPTSSLDYGNQMLILNTIKDLQKSGYTILMSGHDPQQTLYFADRIIALKDSKIIADGTTKTWLNKKLIKDLYNLDVEIASINGGYAITQNKINV